MATTASRFDFHPPRPQGTGRALSWAMLAHLALLAALAWGVSWKREAALSTVEAELWSSLPQQAAPKLQEAAPPPAPQAEKAPEPPAQKTPEIAVEKEKPKPKIEPKPEAKPEPKPAKVDKAAEDRRLAVQHEKERQEQLQRMAGLAGASGGATSQGSVQQSSGSSTGYAGLIKGRVRPNLVFPGALPGNPQVSVEVRLAADGTVLGRPRVLKSSGSKEWDEAVVRAFEKTEVLPGMAAKFGRLW